MFQALQPLVAERSIHLLISSTADGRMTIYVEPAKKNDKEDDAFITPFRAHATPAELDAQLPAILTQWIASRQLTNTSLADQLAEAETVTKKAADEAKKKAAEKGKKPATIVPTAPKPVVKVESKPSTPSLLDAPVIAATLPVLTIPAVSEAAVVAPVDSDALVIANEQETSTPETHVIHAVAAPMPEVEAVSASATTEAPMTSISTESTTPDLWD